MAQQTLRTMAAMLTGVALVTALSACGDSDPTDPQTQRALDSVLTDGDFPDGYEVVKLGKDDETVITDQLDDSRKDAKVTPAACASQEKAPDVADTGRVVAVNGDATLSQSVAVSDVDAATLAAAVTGECAQVSVEVTTGAASGTTVDIAHTDVTEPEIDGHRGVVLTQVSTVTSGDHERRELLIGRVPVDGYLVTVQAVNADGSAPDRGAFDATLDAAVRAVSESA